MAKNNNYGNYILSDVTVDYELFGYNRRDLTQFKHQFVSKNKLTIQYLDIHVERLNSDPYIRNLPFYKTICNICNKTYWRKKSYDKYKRNMCGFKCQGNALAKQVRIRTFEHPGINSYGYPCFVDQRRQITCHRYAMELHLGRKLTSEEIEILPTLSRGAALRFFLTRTHDWFHTKNNIFIKPKNPLEYLNRLNFHRSVQDISAYGLN